MIQLNKAIQALRASEKRAESLGVAVSTAIVDEHGTLLAFSKMDGSISISPKFAFAKAYTAGTIGMATGDMAAYAMEGKAYYDINSLFGGELTTIAGGLAVQLDGKLIGGVGVGGSMDVNQDLDCAHEALAVLVS